MNEDSNQDPSEGDLLKPAKALDEWAEALSGIWYSRTNSNDFQTLEYNAIQELMNERIGRYSTETLATILQWNADSMRSVTNGSPAPPMPNGFDFDTMDGALQQFMDRLDAKYDEDKRTVSKYPYLEETTTEPDIQVEYVKLVGEHEQMLQLGVQYGSFDPLGKLAFLDAIEGIEERWDIFANRLQLMGVNPKYQKQVQDIFSSRDLTEDDYWEIHEKVRRRMRQDAEDERNSFA